MSHDHPVDPYRNESQSLLNMVRLFDIKGTARLYLIKYEQLGPERHIWMFDVYENHYALILDSFIADIVDEAAFLHDYLHTDKITAVAVAGQSDFITENDNFDSLVLFAYELPAFSSTK